MEGSKCQAIRSSGIIFSINLALWERLKQKNMFGGTALLRNGSAFAKIKHGTLWLKVADNNINDFIEKGMTQYTYGKDNSRKLNFYDAPAEVLEEPEMLIQWTKKAIEAANSS